MSYFAESLKDLRTKANFSMQELADLAQVSKSMISKIERGEVQPTLDVAARLAKALGKTLSEMLHTSPQASSIVFLPKIEQAVWEDAQKIKRRNISPVFEGLSVEWISVEMPPGANIQKCALSHAKESPKFILVKNGTLTMVIANQIFELNQDDSLYFDASLEHEFANKSQAIVEFYVVIKHG